MKKRWLLIPVVLLLAGGSAVLLDPTCTLPGFLKGDRFYRYRSATYWRKALREDDPVHWSDALQTWFLTR